jgi:hypothetical protein
MTRSFRDHHQKLARLVLVHVDANLSLLKLEPNLGTCSHCGKVEQLRMFPHYVEALCVKCCIESSGYLITKTASRTLFQLRDADLEGLVSHEFENPLSPNFVKMKLYRRADIRHVAESKHGDTESIVLIHVRKAERMQELHDLWTSKPARLLRGVPTHEDRQVLQKKRQRPFGKIEGRTLDGIKKRLEKSKWE